MRLPTLTQRAIAALLSVAREFDAGHDGEMVEAAGLAAKGKGDAFLDDLQQGVTALTARKNHGDMKRARGRRRRDITEAQMRRLKGGA